MIDENYNPIPRPSEPRESSIASKPTSVPDYKSTKLMAFRMAEGESDDDETIWPQKGSSMEFIVEIDVSHIPEARPNTSASSFGVTPPPQKTLSMAERRALPGKTTKIVAAKTATTRFYSQTPSIALATKTMPTISGSAIMNEKFIMELDNDAYSPPDTSSDDDTSIPDSRPIRPRVHQQATLSLHNLKSNPANGIASGSGATNGMRRSSNALCKSVK